MPLSKIELTNFTVFKELNLDLSSGVNIFVGDNGTGKTHLMKILYAATQATRHDVSFSNKLVRVFKPDNLEIHRLLKRSAGNTSSQIKVCADNADISLNFNNLTKKWDGIVTGEDKWEKQLVNLTSTFIPAKEILSNAWNLESAVSKNNVDFDDTYVDIISSAKVDISKGRVSDTREKYLKILRKMTQATVLVEKEKFYLKPGSQAKLEFPLVAEGLRKIALLWQLIKNGTLERGSILFWDEPEANINPVHIPAIVDLLLQLQGDGVQIFVSTHDYILSKYFDIRKKNDVVKYYSFYHSDKNVVCEYGNSFVNLKNNPLIKAFDKLLDDVYCEQNGQ